MRWLVLALTFLAFLSPEGALRAQQIVTLSTRPNVTQSYFLARIPTDPQAIVVLFAGSEGQIHLRTEDGQIRFSAGNFLVRSRAEFVNRNVITAIPDVPSDQASAGMNDAFRQSEAHFSDISAMVADLKKSLSGISRIPDRHQPRISVGRAFGTRTRRPGRRDRIDVVAVPAGPPRTGVERL